MRAQLDRSFPPLPKAIVRLLSALVALGVGCSSPKHDSAPTLSPSGAPSSTVADVDTAFLDCSKKYEAVLGETPSPGAKAFDARRAQFLGRARGEPVIFVDEPTASSKDALSAIAKTMDASYAKEFPGVRVVLLRDRLKFDKTALRTLLLKEGYLYFDDPNDLFYAVEQIKLTDLFDAPAIYILRGSAIRKLTPNQSTRDPGYVFADGPDAGTKVSLLFGDRVAETEAELATPLHRDVAALADREGFDRMKIERLTTDKIAASVRYGTTWAKAVLASDGASLSLECLAEPKNTRDGIASFLASNAWKRGAIANLRHAIAEGVADANPFDRPRGVEGPDRDGELRPYWVAAYLRGQQTFTDDEETYLVFRADGRPYVPQVCVDFVLDSFERAGGSWYAPRGQKPGRIPGRLSFDDFKPENRRAVIGFGQFAESREDLFTIRRFVGDERTPFADREKFFAFLAANADLFEPGDILSIQGLKRDDRVHQHAILLERADPLTGFPTGLADHMHAPRRRSWEGIMAEAPKRSLYYRVRPTEVIFAKMAPPELVVASSK